MFSLGITVVLKFYLAYPILKKQICGVSDASLMNLVKELLYSQQEMKKNLLKCKIFSQAPFQIKWSWLVEKEINYSQERKQVGKYKEQKEVD